MLSYSKDLLKFISIAKAFGPKELFSDLSFTLKSGDRMAIIGENGSGKTTLAKLAVGLIKPDEGKVQCQCSIGYLEQEADQEIYQLSLEKVIKRSSRELNEISQQLRHLEVKISDNPKSSCFANEWDVLHERFLIKGGYKYDALVAEVLSALGLNQVDQKRSFASLSGGERRRAKLAALLLSQSDLLILDEPTNHLDKNGVEWLEHYLQNYQGAVILISHDREFLNRTVNGIYELSEQLRFYSGNYDAYTDQKKRELADLLEKFEAQEKERAHLKSWLKKEYYCQPKPKPAKDNNLFAYKRRTQKVEEGRKTFITQTKRKLHQIEQELMEHPLPKHYTGIKFSFSELKANPAIRFENVHLRRGGKDLLSISSETVAIDDRVILNGPNGCGKSTLLEMIAHLEQPDKGRVIYSPLLKIGYLRQEPLFADESLSLFEYISQRFPMEEHEIRSKLQRSGLLEGELIKKTLRELSIGQKRRLQILELMLGNFNMLLLDEPTNHLAPLFIDELEEALKQFKGPIIAATHDRRFAETGTKFL